MPIHPEIWPINVGKSQNPDDKTFPIRDHDAILFLLAVGHKNKIIMLMGGIDIQDDFPLARVPAVCSLLSLPNAVNQSMYIINPK